MSKWTKASLGDLCEVNIGRTPARDKPEFWGGNNPWLSIADMNQGRDLQSTKEAITDRAVRECNCRLAQPGTVLLSFKLSIGKVGIAKVPLFTNEAIAALPIRDAKRLDTAYLYWALQSVDLTTGLDRAAKGMTLNKAKLLEIQVPLPPLAEQRRIAEVLDRAEALRAQRRATLAQLDSLTQSLFLDLFGDPATNPKGFEKKRLDALVRENDIINYGVVQPGDACEDGVPLVRVGDLIEGKVRQSGLKRIAPTIEAAYRRSRLRGDEILVSCVGSVGVVALADESLKGFNIARAVARIPLAEKTDRIFMAAYLCTDFVQRYFTNELRTVSQPTLNIKQLSETTVMLPPISLQREFARRVTAVENLKAAHRASLAELDALFASLQHRAFRGEL